MKLWWDDKKSGSTAILFIFGPIAVNLYSHGWAFGVRPYSRSLKDFAVDFARLAILFRWGGFFKKAEKRP